MVTFLAILGSCFFESDKSSGLDSNFQSSVLQQIESSTSVSSTVELLSNHKAISSEISKSSYVQSSSSINSSNHSSSSFYSVQYSSMDSVPFKSCSSVEKGFSLSSSISTVNNFESSQSSYELLSSTIISSSSGIEDPHCYEGSPTCILFTDNRDGQVYKSTTINGVTWAAENMNYSGHDEQGNKTFEIGYCYGAEDQLDNRYCSLKGRLYTWYEAMGLDSVSPLMIDTTIYQQGICPNGWHVASMREWVEMITYVAETHDATTKISGFEIWTEVAHYIKDTTVEPNSPAEPGSDVYNFSGAMTGVRYGHLDYNHNLTWGLWWSATPYDSLKAWFGAIQYKNEYFRKNTIDKIYSKAVRCIKDQ